MNSEVECPLCTQIGFQSVDALRTALVSAASRNLICPVCNASLTGLDKLTVHLFGHALPQHDLHNVGQTFKISNDVPAIDTSVTRPSVPKPITMTLPEPTRKAEVVPPCTIPVQSYENFQNEAIFKKASETTSILNQDLSNLVCWLPLMCFPDKLPNPAVNNIGSTNCDLLNRTSLPSQQSEGKGGSKQLLDAAENNRVIIVSLPSLQDLKKQCDSRGISHSTNNITNDLSLSDVSNLSGKLLMLDCSGNSPSNNNISINNPSESSVQMSMLPEQNSPHNPGTSVNILSPNQNSSQLNREVTNIATSCNKNDDIVEQKSQNADSGAANLSNNVFKCPQCFAHFSDSNILSLHQQLIHEGSNSLQTTLTASEKESTSKQELDRTASKEEGSFQCHLCSKTFHMQGSLMVHLRVAHTAPTMVDLASKIEGSISDPSSASTVSTPAASAKIAKDQPPGKGNDNKQWECSDCGKFFTTKYFLKKHKRLHTGEMPYSCPTCSKSFTFQQSYHKHLLYHSDEKPHTCTDCGRSFKELSTLHNHQRIHTGEKPWACETCGKCFRQRVSYLVHRRIHTGAMPYCCTVCNKSFRYKVSQRTHKCIAQPAGANIRQSNDLLQRLLFDQPEGSTSVQSHEGREQGKSEKVANEQIDQTPFVQQKLPEEVQSNPRISHTEQQTSELGTQLLYSLNNDKSAFQQRSEPLPDFSLQNFQLQQTLSNIQTMSQNNIVVQNGSLSVKEDLKQNAMSENGRSVPNSTWCAVKRTPLGQNTDLDPSSLVVLVNDKEMISAHLPDPNVPISLLQLLQKEKYIQGNEFSAHPSVSSTNNLLSNPSCPNAKVGNTVLSSPFVPDFLSIAMAVPNQSHSLIDSGNSNVPPASEAFPWEMPLNMPSHDHSDSITDNVSTSQEAIDSLRSLLFGPPSTEL